MPDKYGDVIIPMTIIRRFECALLDDEVKRKDVIDTFKQNPNYPEKALFRKSGFQFYNTSEYTLQELCNDADHVAAYQQNGQGWMLIFGNQGIFRTGFKPQNL